MVYMLKVNLEWKRKYNETKRNEIERVRALAARQLISEHFDFALSQLAK